MDTKHDSHVTRFSMDASSWDEICVNCGNTDKVPGGWGELARPCPNPGRPYRTLEDYYERNSIEYRYD